MSAIADRQPKAEAFSPRTIRLQSLAKRPSAKARNGSNSTASLFLEIGALRLPWQALPETQTSRLVSTEVRILDPPEHFLEKPGLYQPVRNLCTARFKSSVPCGTFNRRAMQWKILIENKV